MNFDNNHQQCLDKLIWVTERLKVEAPFKQLSKIAKLIVQTMDSPWRYFHSTAHIFEVGGDGDAIEVLAALFHDIVYVQVDKSINFNLTYYLAPFIEEEREKLFIREQNELPEDAIFEMVAMIFGFVPGQALSPFGGQNEFLSTLVAAKVLESFLSPTLIVQVAACIEATIPFRSKTESGFSPSELLHQRLKLTNHQFNLQLTDEDVIQAVKRSVRLANRDVGNFAEPSSAVFLTNTWSILPEINHNLRKSGSYTVRDYREAMQKMLGFLKCLQPELVFHQFQGEPEDSTYYELVERTRKNIEVAQLYLESKLVAIAMIEALSLRFGSDVSLSMMIGELPDSEFSVGRLKDSFPHLPSPYQPTLAVEREVLDLLEIGRWKNSNYDIRNSPVTTFVVKYIGFNEIRRLRERSQAFFQGTISSEDYLASCNSELARIITNGVIKLLENRQATLMSGNSYLLVPSNA
ncbi:hypothetical protein [Allocoleopsis franciscana]|uniref:Uncharacterized protein n=1 Tax=Allocoleopsis franciscana PCC 7113 TaxID=1173027 RepID=K9WPP4_9CYAN|nr:hypothetical protein [Allocoleopsis franciscana]AFZ21754.1 hypothetical protein Mic7113_6162 [Allocoleopsis franciscana PCC 7113]